MKKNFLKITPSPQAALLESNPPVNKLTSPLSGGTRESFEIFYFLTLLPPLKGEVPERSEGGGVVIKKGKVAERSEGGGVNFKRKGRCRMK